MMFSKNPTNENKANFNKYLNIPINENIQSYLILPTQVLQSKKQTFNYLLDKVIQNLKWVEDPKSFIC